MGGMLRYPDEKKFQEMLAKSHAKVHEPRIVRPLEGEGVRVATPAVPAPGNKPKAVKAPSEIETLMAEQIAACSSIPAPVREYPYLRGSRHRLDFAWPEHRINGMQIGLEVQGMAHRTRERFLPDIEKRALGILQDWLVLEAGGDHIRNGKAMAWLQQLFAKIAAQ